MENQINRRSLLSTAGLLTAGVGVTGLSTPAIAASSSVGFFNVKDFGAMGDGINNDQAAIQAAILAASPNNGAQYQRNFRGGIVYLPAGTYLVNAIRLNRNVTLMGDGMGTLIAQADNTNTAVIANAGNLEYPVAISHLRIRGTVNPSSNGSSARGIYLRSTPDYGGFSVPDGQHIIDQVWIERTYNDCIYIKKDCRGTTINNCWIKGSETRNGIVINGSDSSIINTISRSHARTGFVIRAGNTRVASSKAFFCRNGGFLISSSRCHINACEAQDNWNNGFLIEGNDAMLTGCLADSNQLSGFYLRPSGSGLYGICINGFMALGRNEVQASKPWVGQAYGIRFSGNIFKSSFAGIAKANDLNVRNDAVFDSLTQTRNIVASGFIAP